MSAPAAPLSPHERRTEATVKDAVLAAAHENSTLLVKLGETEPAPNALALHQQKITKLKAEIQEQTQVLDALKDQVDAKFRVHKKYNDSTTRRLLYRASFMLEKLEMKAERGEKEYFSVLGVQNQAETRCATLRHDLVQAEDEEPEFKRKAEEHGETHEKIDQLYEDLFAGPTPGFSQEDGLESRFYAARGHHESVRQRIISARRSANVLEQALRSISRADRLLDQAAFQARDSFFIFDEAQNSIDLSVTHVDYALASLLEAGDILQPRSQDATTAKNKVIHDLQLAKTEHRPAQNREAYATTIRTSKFQLDKAREHVKDFVSLCTAREQVGLEEIRKTARTLEDSRQSLHQERMGIFEKVAGFGEAAPSYQECCDRADNLCILPPPLLDPIDEEDDDLNERNDVVSPVLPDYDDATGLSGSAADHDRAVSPLETRAAGGPVEHDHEGHNH